MTHVNKLGSNGIPPTAQIETEMCAGTMGHIVCIYKENRNLTFYDFVFDTETEQRTITLVTVHLFYKHGQTLFPTRISNHMPPKSFIHYQISTVAPLKFGNG